MSTPPTAIKRSDYRPPAWWITQVDLQITLEEQGTLVEATLALERNPAVIGSEPLRLDGEGLETLGIWLDGEALAAERYRIDAEGLWLEQLPPRCSLRTRVRIHPEQNTALEGLYRSGGLFCTQCEAEGFRKITWYLDRPDVMARFTTTLLADRQRYPVLLANGNPVASEQLADGRHQITWVDPHPKPSYLFALVAGDLHKVEGHYTTRSGREVELCIYVEPENLDQCDHAMLSLQRAMAWDEERYGREYDLDIYMIVAVNDFNMGAMENKGLNIFNAKFVLARPDTATDQDFQGIEAVIAHEYFHNWSGNRVTCRDWFQLSLKEGFTVFRDQQFSAEMGSHGVKRIGDVRLLRQHQFAEDGGPMAHPVRPHSYMEINNFYTVTVYEKGAEVVRMLHRLLGAEAFRQATDRYFARYDGQAVTLEEFVGCMAAVSGRELDQFWHWYNYAGTPELHLRESWEPEPGSYTLEVTQSCPPTPGQPEKPPFHIPFALGLLTSEGEALPVCLEGEPTSAGVETRLLELTSATARWRFSGLPSRPTPSLLRDFSAPVRLHFDYSEAQLTTLIAHDSDPFNRWDAAQTLMQRTLLQAVAAGGVVTPNQSLIHAMQAVIEEQGGDLALRAELLDLPGEAWLGDQLAEVAVEAIHQAREGLIQQLAEALRQPLLALYHSCNVSGPYHPHPADMARRSLKNRALSWLMRLPDDPEVAALCTAQYRANHNMTDVMAALEQIASSEIAERDALLDHFYQQWRQQPLVLDKWFRVQALSRRSDTLAQVQRLLHHPDFTLRNPNRVRALLGSFSAANPRHFHAADGSGYRLLCAQVRQLDPLNPQVAARLLTAIARWRRYDPSRQQQMREQLAQLLATPDISPDLFEIASKSLGGQ